MKESKIFLLIGLVMVFIIIIFVGFALSHPEMSFYGGNKVAYPVYIVYLIATITMFVLAKVKAKG